MCLSCQIFNLNQLFESVMVLLEVLGRSVACIARRGKQILGQLALTYDISPCRKTKYRPRRDSNSQSSDSKSDALSIRPRGPDIFGRGQGMHDCWGEWSRRVVNLWWGFERSLCFSGWYIYNNPPWNNAYMLQNESPTGEPIQWNSYMAFNAVSLVHTGSNRTSYTSTTIGLSTFLGFLRVVHEENHPNNSKQTKNIVRGQPELNRWPLDLQSNALPLSYIPLPDIELVVEHSHSWRCPHYYSLRALSVGDSWEKRSAQRGARTHDPGIKSPMLYRLS